MGDQVDGGQRAGASSEESAEIKTPKVENRGLREEGEIKRRATSYFVGETRPPQPLMVGFIDTMRAKGYAGEVDLLSSARAGLADRRAVTLPVVTS